MSISCHAGVPCSILPGVACHSVLFTLFYFIEKFLTAGHWVYFKPCLAARHIIVELLELFPPDPRPALVWLRKYWDRRLCCQHGEQNVNHIDNSLQRWWHKILLQFLPSKYCIFTHLFEFFTCHLKSLMFIFNKSRALLKERADFPNVGPMTTNKDFLSSTLSMILVEKHWNRWKSARRSCLFPSFAFMAAAA